ncbi:hypothetical protein LTR53_014197 [Teratosphaeriaceae sp. CCFEE 6253]|nr:hypothetical protein LTR53_014197 [Teratosphaeriaceae sp. CCFEE 6253]
MALDQGGKKRKGSGMPTEQSSLPTKFPRPTNGDDDGNKGSNSPTVPETPSKKLSKLTIGEYQTGRPGGFIKPHATRFGVQKMKWTADNDRKLLLLGLGREISPKEYPAIASSYDEKPTAKSVQERLTKLRKEQRERMAQLSLVGDLIPINDVLLADDSDAMAIIRGNVIGTTLGDLVHSGQITAELAAQVGREFAENEAAANFAEQGPAGKDRMDES